MDHLQETGLRVAKWPIPQFVSGHRASFSTTGLIVGVLFFAASLTPSLIPRPYVIQAVISGLSLSAGYAIGVFLRWLWSFLELPDVRPRTGLILKLVAALGCTALHSPSSGGRRRGRIPCGTSWASTRSRARSR